MRLWGGGEGGGTREEGGKGGLGGVCSSLTFPMMLPTSWDGNKSTISQRFNKSWSPKPKLDSFHNQNKLLSS